MIDKINQEIKELEREKTKHKRGNCDCRRNEYCLTEIHLIEAKLKQAKKDKKIIEEGLEELRKELDRKGKSEINIQVVKAKIDQKLKNQNG